MSEVPPSPTAAVPSSAPASASALWSDGEDGRASAVRVLKMEAEALVRLAGSLDGAIAEALGCLAAVTGRVVVTGMGKSGHIARKIAATLSSTGTPALYVHPGEASHGDLGMIARNDGVIALSNSGETSELSDIVAYTRRFRIPLIAVTRNAGSTLAEQADVLLLLPTAPEACPLGLAPTTSTTMMLALGDSLAVALLERKGFSPSDFQIYHPGGKLGRQLLKVSDLMHQAEAVPLVPLDRMMSDVLLVMTTKSFGCAGVIDTDGRLVGIITDGDLRRHMAPGLIGRSAGGVMTPSPQAIRPAVLAAEALRLMNERKITSLFVVDDALHPLGIVHLHDCLRAGIA